VEKFKITLSELCQLMIEPRQLITNNAALRLRVKILDAAVMAEALLSFDSVRMTFFQFVTFLKFFPC
jgi:hypothetical protein